MAAGAGRAWASAQRQVAQAGQAMHAFSMVTLPRAFSRVATSASAVIARLSVPKRQQVPVPAVKTAGSPRGTSHRALTAWAAGGAVVVALGLVSAYVFRSEPAVPPVLRGSVSIDAFPWATVVAIVAQDGTPQALPEPASTPLSLQLPVGVYRITLEAPAGAAATREFSITVEDGKEARLQDVRFDPLSAEAYFERYLSAVPDAASSGTGDVPAQAVGAPAREGTR